MRLTCWMSSLKAEYPLTPSKVATNIHSTSSIINLGVRLMIIKSVAFSDSGNLTAADPSLKPTYMCENTVQSLTPSKSLSLSPIAVTNSYGKTFSNHWNTHKYGKHWPLNWKQNTNWNVTWLNLLYFICPQKRLFFPEETTVLLLTSVP